MLKASWCLQRMSRYLSLNLSGTCMWHHCWISSLESFFLFPLGKWLWISWHTDEMKSSMRGTISSSSVSMIPKMSYLSRVTSQGAQFSKMMLQMLFSSTLMWLSGWWLFVFICKPRVFSNFGMRQPRPRHPPCHCDCLCPLRQRLLRVWLQFLSEWWLQSDIRCPGSWYSHCVWQ